MLNLLVLKNNFNDIKNLRESSINLMRSLGEKVETLKIIYNELIANNLNETDTGLDSLHFQTKLINLELDNYQKTFKIIDNRVYGDYYKLFRKLTKYLNENIKNKNITIQFDNKEYQVYKDLNNIQDYDFGSTTEIYNDIIQIIDILQNELLERELVIECKEISNIIPSIEKAISFKPPTKNIDKFVKDVFLKLDGKSAERISDAIINLLDNNIQHSN